VHCRRSRAGHGSLLHGGGCRFDSGRVHRCDQRVCVIAQIHPASWTQIGRTRSGRCLLDAALPVCRRVPPSASKRPAKASSAFGNRWPVAVLRGRRTLMTRPALDLQRVRAGMDPQRHSRMSKIVKTELLQPSLFERRQPDLMPIVRATQRTTFLHHRYGDDVVPRVPRSESSIGGDEYQRGTATGVPPRVG
jgi:hypothetical protein